MLSKELKVIMLFTLVLLLLVQVGYSKSLLEDGRYELGSSELIDDIAYRYMDANGDEFLEIFWKLQHDKENFTRVETPNSAQSNKKEEVYMIWRNDKNDTIIYNKETRTLKFNNLLLALTSDNPAHFASDENGNKVIHQSSDNIHKQHVLTAALGNYPSPDSARTITLFLIILSILPFLVIIVFSA